MLGCARTRVQLEPLERRELVSEPPFGCILRFLWLLGGEFDPCGRLVQLRTMEGQLPARDLGSARLTWSNWAWRELSAQRCSSGSGSGPEIPNHGISHTAGHRGSRAWEMCFRWLWAHLAQSSWARLVGPNQSHTLPGPAHMGMLEVGELDQAP